MNFSLFIATPIFTKPQDENVKIAKGSSLKFTCEASAFPEPTVKFIRDGKIIASSAVFSKLAVDSSDAGIYTCRAENNVGHSDKNFNLTIVEPPTITTNFNNVTLVDEDQTENVTCTANAVPEPTIKWFYEDSILMVDGAVLRLTTLSDRGIYTCVAENTEGSAKKLLYANIRHLNPFKNISDISKEVVVKEKDDFELRCPYKNYQNIKWSLNNQKLPSDGEYKEDKNKLTVKNVKRTHKGDFSCLVTDHKDNFTFEYNVDVLAVPVIIPSWTKDNLAIKYPPNSDIEEHKFKMGDKLTLLCDSTGNPAPNVNSFKANSQIKEGEIYSIDNLNSEHR